MRRRQWLIAVVVLLGVVLIAWLLYFQVLLWRTPSPRWTVSAGEAGVELSACSGARTLAAYNVQPVDDPASASIGKSEAKRIAERVIIRERGSLVADMGSSPGLVQITLPDGEERLAWSRVLVTDSGGATLIGKGDIVYVDAHTGDPLLLITDVQIDDPVITCGSDIGPMANDVFERLLPLALLAIYVLVLGLIGGLVLLRRRAAARRALDTTR